MFPRPSPSQACRCVLTFMLYGMLAPAGAMPVAADPPPAHAAQVAAAPSAKRVNDEAPDTAAGLAFGLSLLALARRRLPAVRS